MHFIQLLIYFIVSINFFFALQLINSIFSSPLKTTFVFLCKNSISTCFNLIENQSYENLLSCIFKFNIFVNVQLWFTLRCAHVEIKQRFTKIMENTCFLLQFFFIFLIKNMFAFAFSEYTLVHISQMSGLNYESHSAIQQTTCTQKKIISFFVSHLKYH